MKNTYVNSNVIVNTLMVIVDYISVIFRTALPASITQYSDETK